MMSKDHENLITVQPLGGFDQLLTYSLKEEFSSIIRIGSLVKIPLGKRKVLGIVWSLNSTEIIHEKQIRSIHEVVHQQPVLTEEMTKLAKWISKYYCCSIDSCLEAMIPAAIRDGVKTKTRRQISLSKRNGKEDDLLNRSQAQASIISYLRKRNSPISVSELLKETGRSASSLISLKKKGLIQESEEIVEREAYEDDFTDSIETAHESISLTLEQQTAIQAINDDLKSKKFKAHLLNGVTGSGKQKSILRQWN